MHILLINNNPVVSRLLSLCMRDKAFSLEEAGNADEIKDDTYDLIFVDDASYSDEVQERIDMLNAAKTVFLTRRNEENRLFGKTIVKPFLPSQIMEVIKEVKKEENQAIRLKDHFIFPLSAETLEDESAEALEDDFMKTNILNDKEIEKIKNLLDMDEDEDLYAVSDEMNEEGKIEIIKRQLVKDGLEIIDEKEFFESFAKSDKADKESPAPTDEKQTIKPKQQDTHLAFEEALFQAIGGMKVKKIRKLLKGAEVSITIRFKDKA